MVSHFNLSSSHQAVVKQSWGSRQAVVRQSSGSHQAISRQYSGSRQAVIRQSQSSNTHPRVLFQVPPIKSQHLPSIAQPVRYWRPFKPSRFFKKKKKKSAFLKKLTCIRWSASSSLVTSSPSFPWSSFVAWNFLLLLDEMKKRLLCLVGR